MNPNRRPLIDSAIILLLACVLIGPLFRVEYLNYWGSIESTFIGDARMLREHLLHPAWQPLWYCGTRFDYIYPPALRYGTALISLAGGISTARAYHIYTAFFYVLGIVGVYFLAYIASRSRAQAWLASMFTLLLSPDQFDFGKPVKVVNDYITGWLANLGTLAALRRRAVEGGSYRVTVALTRTNLWLLSLGIFDKAFALSEARDVPFSSITIIEFKKPQRDDYSEKENPFTQVAKYIAEIREGKATTVAGRPMPIPPNLPFYCYVICDITPSLKEWARLFELQDTPDSLGFFGYKRFYNAYFEVISYSKLVADAEKRNKIFFQKLGLPGSIP